MDFGDLYELLDYFLVVTGALLLVFGYLWGVFLIILGIVIMYASGDFSSLGVGKKEEPDAGEQEDDETDDEGGDEGDDGDDGGEGGE